MRAYVLSTGDELVRGRTRDTNTAEISVALAAEGVTVVGASLVGDDREALTAAILRAAEAADLVVMSGGLGPTEDDCTRFAAAAAVGVELERRPELVEALERRWAARRRGMPPSNLVQADLPEGAEVLPNRHGTAAGFALDVGPARFLALPGPPRELRGVLEEEALPRIRARLRDAGHTDVVRTRTIETFGWPESRVGEKLGELMRRDVRPRMGTSATAGTIRVIVSHEGPVAHVDAALDAAVTEVRRRLGPVVFGTDGATLADAAVAALLASGTTVATAESCTGGLVAGALTDVPGVSDVFVGGVVAYSNAQKTRLLGVPERLIEAHGAVSEEVARSMAMGARRAFGTDLGIAVTGVAGPGGGTDDKPVGLVHVALDDRGDVRHRELRFPGGRALIRTLTVKTALDLIRRAAADRPPSR